MKRDQHITKLQSKLIQDKNFIDLKLDEAIAKHCYFEKKKQNMSYCHKLSYPKFHLVWNSQKLDETPSTALHTIPITPPNTQSKATLQHIINKRPVSNTQQAHFKRIRKGTFLYKFNDEIDDAQLLSADCN